MSNRTSWKKGAGDWFEQQKRWQKVWKKKEKDEVGPKVWQLLGYKAHKIPLKNSRPTILIATLKLLPRPPQRPRGEREKREPWINQKPSNIYSHLARMSLQGGSGSNEEPGRWLKTMGTHFESHCGLVRHLFQHFAQIMSPGPIEYANEALCHGLRPGNGAIYVLIPISCESKRSRWLCGWLHTLYLHL